jgi:uncharacterized membrane protein YgcG
MWMDVMRSPACLIIHRHPARTALSLARKRAASGPLAGLGPEEWLRVWEGSMLSALQTCRGRPTVLVQVRQAGWRAGGSGAAGAAVRRRAAPRLTQRAARPRGPSLAAPLPSAHLRPHPFAHPLPQSSLTQPENVGLFYETVLPALSRAGLGRLTAPPADTVDRLYARHYRGRNPVTGALLEPGAAGGQQQQQQQEEQQQQKQQQEQQRKAAGHGGGSSRSSSGGISSGGSSSGGGKAAAAAGPKLIGGYEAVGEGVRRLVGGVEVDQMSLECDFQEVAPEQLRNGSLHG